MDNKGEQVPSFIHDEIPKRLFHRAVALLGYYHASDRSDQIFTHLLRLVSVGDDITAQLVFSLSFFLEYSEKNEQHANALLGLDWDRKAKRALYYHQEAQHPAYRIMIYTLMDLIKLSDR